MITLNFFHMGMSNKDVALRFMGIYQAQFRGIENASNGAARVDFTLNKPNPAADVIICTASATDIHRAATETQKPLILYVPPIDQWFDAPLLTPLKNRIHFAYGPVISEVTTAAYLSLGITYHYLPFAADPDLMRPLNLAPQYDLVFLGGLQHRRGYQPFIEPLLKTLDPKRLLFIGSGWEKYGIPSQSIAYGPLVNILYNLGRVCINFHAPEQIRGTHLQLDLNNRVFDLAMAGTLQVSDNPAAIAMHFDTQREIFAEPTAEAWVARVLNCLSLPDEALASTRRAARTRALAEHTWTHRGHTFLSWINT